MKTDLDFQTPQLFGPAVFRPQFNNFKEISATQAWSLFFTGSREMNRLGTRKRIGWTLSFGLLSMFAFAIFGEILLS